MIYDAFLFFKKCTLSYIYLKMMNTIFLFQLIFSLIKLKYFHLNAMLYHIH